MANDAQRIEQKAHGVIGVAQRANALRVTHFHRLASPDYFSLERVFAVVRAHLPSDIIATPGLCPCPSKGILNRLYNMVWARRNISQVNHITGDVHYLTLVLPRKRTILTIADCGPLQRRKGLGRAIIWLLWYWMPVKHAQLITVISEYTKQELLGYVDCKPSKIVVVHCPVSPIFRAQAKPYNSSEPVFLQVGAGWNKNLAGVAEALKGIHCRLVIVGSLDGKQRDALEHNGILYENHERVSDSELATLYQRCDILLFVSFYEGFGLPIVEAQSVGRPVVTSTICSMPEVAGGAACLVDPGNPLSIREGVLKIMNDAFYRESLIQSGFENVKRFAPSKIAADYAGLYKALCENQE